MVKQISDNEIYLLIKYIKSVLWRVVKRLSYTEDARCLKINTINESTENNKRHLYDKMTIYTAAKERGNRAKGERICVLARCWGKNFSPYSKGTNTSGTNVRNKP